MDRAEAARRWLAGETLEVIAVPYGVTREAVRQHVHAQLGEGIVGLHRARMKARTHLRAYVNTEPHRLCVVCGQPARSRTETVAMPFCPIHNAWGHQGNRGRYTALRRLIDPEYHAHHAAYLRAYNGEPEPTYQGTWTNRTKRRHAQQGSSIDWLIREAIANDWPLLDRLPDDIRDQYGLAPIG